jgi:hypothetical protein
VIPLAEGGRQHQERGMLVPFSPSGGSPWQPT